MIGSLATKPHCTNNYKENLLKKLSVHGKIKMITIELIIYGDLVTVANIFLQVY